MDIPSTEEWRFTDIQFLPIFKEYAKQINLVETINAMVESPAGTARTNARI